MWASYNPLFKDKKSFFRISQCQSKIWSTHFINFIVVQQLFTWAILSLVLFSFCFSPSLFHLFSLHQWQQISCCAWTDACIFALLSRLSVAEVLVLPQSCSCSVSTSDGLVPSQTLKYKLHFFCPFEGDFLTCYDSTIEYRQDCSKRVNIPKSSLKKSSCTYNICIYILLTIIEENTFDE